MRSSILLGSLLLGCATAGGDVEPPVPNTSRDAGGSDAPAGPDAGPSASAPPRPVGPIAESLVGADVPSPRVGMLYFGWHAPPATVMRTLTSRRSPTVTVEDVLRSGGSKKLADVLQSSGLEAEAMGFHYQVRPKLGFYCIYRARSGETGHLPDCPGIENTLATHAAQLVAAGVDHVVMDATNLSAMDRDGDVLQLRPTEVLFEEWSKLRKRGIQTPQIAVWHAIPTGSTQWKGYEALYRNPEYDGLVLRDKKTNKKVFFVVDPPDGARSPDPFIASGLGSAGFVVQRMWTLEKTDGALDRWAFMSPCQDGAAPTTSIVDAPPCAQPHSARSSLGTAIAVSPSFQTGYGSLPWGASGRLSGLTFKRQWATAFALRPDWVFISGWNELTAQPQPNPLGDDPFARSLGLEADPGGARLFVDTFGAEYGRDIEPTEEYGDTQYELTRSCIRVFKRGATACTDAAEACCDPQHDWRTVWVLTNAAANDTLLTNTRGERDALLAGGAWREVCARYGTPSVFCAKSTEAKSPAGPFLAWAKAGPGRRPLHRCRVGDKHFYTLDAACEGQVFESVVAWLSTTPSGETPRRAQRCFHATTGERFVAVGWPCPTGTNDEGLLGYVR